MCDLAPRSNGLDSGNYARYLLYVKFNFPGYSSIIWGICGYLRTVFPPFYAVFGMKIKSRKNRVIGGGDRVNSGIPNMPLEIGIANHFSEPYWH